MQTILQIVLFFVCLHGLLISLNANNWCLHKETFGKFNVTTDCQLQYEIAIVGGNQLELEGMGYNLKIHRVDDQPANSNNNNNNYANNGLHRLFNISQNSKLILRNLILQGGNVQMKNCSKRDVCYGGAIYVAGTSSSLIVDNVFIINNHAVLGGAIFGIDGASIQLYNAVVEDCKASVAGGAVFVAGLNSIVSVLAGSIIRRNMIDSSSSSNNSSLRRLLFNYQQDSRRSSSIVSFTESGGGMYCSTLSLCIINASVVSENKALNLGGGLICDFASCKILSNSIMALNQAAGNKTSSHFYFSRNSNVTNDGTLIGYACPSGKFGPRIRFGHPVDYFSESSNCTNCSYGKYSGKVYGATTEINACSNHCKPGKYGDMLGQVYESQCKDCIEGFYCPGTCDGAIKIDCPFGHFCAKSVSFATLCPNGTYSHYTKAAKCMSCEKGFKCPTGGVSRAVCRPGTYNNASGEIACYECPIGSYCAGITHKSDCPQGKYGNKPGQTSEAEACTKCTEGMLCPGGAFKSDCPPGQFGDPDAAGQCKPCPYGFYCEGGKKKEECPTGRYHNLTNQSSINSCIDCMKGYYCRGGNDQTPCPVAKYGSKKGGKNEDDGCAKCELGKYGTGNGKDKETEACRSCSPGFYGNGLDQSSNSSYCNICPKGHICQGKLDKTRCELVSRL